MRDGIFTLTQDLFGVSIRPWKTDVWHPSVEAYDLYDGKKLLGRFFLDLHPREGKYEHAAQFGIRKGVRGIQLPEAALAFSSRHIDRVLPRFPAAEAHQPRRPERCQYEDLRRQGR